MLNQTKPPMRRVSPSVRRVVKRKPAKPVEDRTPGIRGHIKRFFLSFTPGHFKKYWFSRAGLYRVLSFFGLCLLFVILLFAWYAKDLPNPNKINSRISAQTTKFYDRTGGKLLYELSGDQNRQIIAFEQMPATIKNATVAIEDKDFYKHGAFDIFGIGRALTGVLTGVNKGGGSTITQQYVKNTLLTSERSYARKIKELILSIEIEQRYSKNDILKLYLNEIPYGNRAFGIESACKTYFPQNKDETTTARLCAKNLTVGQAALLAAVPKAPTYYNPYGSNIDKLLERQHYILDLMAEQKYISKADAAANKWDEAKLKAEINPVQNLYGSLEPSVAHFVLFTQDYLIDKFGSKTVTEGGLKVITTLDWEKQQSAYNSIQKNMTSIRGYGGSNAALVATDPKSGQVLSMIGSYDFNNKDYGEFNVATAGRQPGSSFKPIVYATLIGTNQDESCAKTRECPTYGPGTTLYDAPTNFNVSGTTEYKPANFGNKNYGFTTVRSALAGSLNRPAVKALYMAGVDNAIDTAKALGITTLNQQSSFYGLSLVLGSGEVQLTQMANAYESFANGGLHYEQTPVLKVSDSTGKVLEDNSTPAKPKQAIDPQVAYLMADMLSDNNAKRYVFGNSLDFAGICGNNNSTGCIHAGSKTGTTEHFNDAWTMGITPEISVGIWVGNNDNAEMSAAAANVAAPIWQSFMNMIYRDKGIKSTEAFAKPEGIKSVTLDKKTGRLPTSRTTQQTTDIFPSWYTPMSASSDKSATIDKISKKLATNCTPELARDTIYASSIMPEISYKDIAFNNWLKGMYAAGLASSGTPIPTESDDIHNCSDAKPTVKISGADESASTYNLSIEVELGAFGTTKSGVGSATLTVYLDGQIISTRQVNASGAFEVSTTPSAGQHTFKAVIVDSGYYQSEDSATTTALGAETSVTTPDPEAAPQLATPAPTPRKVRGGTAG